jgi:hypothetical protein
MPPEAKRKPRERPQPYKRQPKQSKPTADAPKTSAKPAESNRRENLTLHDWLTVFKWMDDHPEETQKDVIDHFATRKEGALIFSQPSLFRNLRKRAELEARKDSNPVALSSKRPRIVTQPQVERALYLWVKSMEAKGETVSGPMLKAKRQRFEEKLNVPQEERLTGDGWLGSFCRTYRIKEIRRHGEAGSVDLEAVGAERERVQKIVEEYPPENVLNFDETGFFAFAPPERGLATKQMSGKKKDKFRITIGFLCSQTGEKFEPVFIGKFNAPRPFKAPGKKTPRDWGFDYSSNAKAWMTMEIFEPWLKWLDIMMGAQKRKVLLLVDNFGAHDVAYQPKNVRVEFFEPNMTSYVQPLDAGIIRCFKAVYRRMFCLRAVDLEEAGEENIYKINLLEAMKMAKKAWDEVESKTIQNCWEHTGILPNPSLSSKTSSTTATSQLPYNVSVSSRNTWQETGQEIIRKFAVSSEMTLPQAEKELEMNLGLIPTGGRL